MSLEATFAHLVEGRRLLPKKRLERQMLLLGTVCGLDAAGQYPESEINDHLKTWITRFGTDLSIDIDDATLRSYLVEEAILDRLESHPVITEESPPTVSR